MACIFFLIASILLLLLLERWWVEASFRSTDSEENFFRSKDSEENLQILLWHCKTRDSHAPALPVVIPGFAQLSTQIIKGSKRYVESKVCSWIRFFTWCHPSTWSIPVFIHIFVPILVLFIHNACLPIFALVSDFYFISCFFNKMWLLKEIVHFAFQLLEMPSSQSMYEGTKPELVVQGVQ